MASPDTPRGAQDIADATEPTAPKKDLPPAAQRALAEAQARREAGQTETRESADLPKEINGRGGKEPTRYADWEVKGIAVDF
ncbi:MAG: DUF1674 domain-containing protein [Pseudomonadota bacterium]